MNREIKFRVPHFFHKDNSFSHFNYWGRIDQEQKASSECFTSPGSTNMTYAGKDEQFIGLKDKIGVEIYEGDFVNCNRYENEENYLVEIKDIRNLPSELFGSNLNHREIIGNIHENHNLLNQQP